MNKTEEDPKEDPKMQCRYFFAPVFLTGPISIQTASVCIVTGDTCILMAHCNIQTAPVSILTAPVSILTAPVSILTGRASILTGRASILTGRASIAQIEFKTVAQISENKTENHVNGNSQRFVSKCLRTQNNCLTEAY